jgi:ComF family protein
LKYRGKKEISSFFGKWLGAELAENNNYKEIEMVIPVPLHKQKLKKRGFNQVEGFGKEIALALNVPYRDDILIKISKTGSQVFKTRILRFEAEELFYTQNLGEIKNKHILLVDDIITTGATLEKCALQLLKGENVNISVATIATT